MTFLTPLLAGIAAAIAIPSLIILYFLKLRRRDLEVSTTLLWKKAIQDLQANAPFQKLRRNILLLLQLLALCAALFAIAQPEFRADTTVGKRSIILVDRSASMQATDGDKDKPEAKLARLDDAKKEALKFVDSLREPGIFEERGDEAMLIVFDTAAEVRQNFTSDKNMLKSAINAIEPSDAPSSIEQAFKLAKAYTGTQKFEDQVQENKGFVPAGPGAIIHLFSDGRLPDAEKVNTALEDTVVYHAIGRADSTNIGIVGLQATRAFNDPNKLSIFVGLQNTAREARKVDVQMAIDEVIQRVSTVTVPQAIPPQDTVVPVAAPKPKPADASDGTPAKTAEPVPEWKPGVGGVVFTIDRVEGGVVTIKLINNDDDALAADDLAYLVFPPAKRLAVALVTEGSLFLRIALEGLDLSKFKVMKPPEFQQLLDEGKTGEYDVIVLDGWLPKVKPENGKGDAVPGLPPGRVLAMNVAPASAGIIDEGEGERSLIVDFKREHPALKNAALDLLDIVKSRKVHLAPDAPSEAIAQTQDGPAIIETTDVRTHAIVVPFNAVETNWPLDPGYVLFLAGSLTYLSDSGGAGPIVRPGQTLSSRLPQGATDAKLTLPSRDRLDLSPAADGSVAYGPIRKTGIYTVTWTGPATPTDEVSDDGRARRHVAANLLDPEESDIGTRPVLAMAREVVQAKEGGSANLSRKLWPWLLLGALAVVMLEWFVYNKRVHI